MPMNRSPCLLPPGLLAHPAESPFTLPPGMTLLQESAPAVPSAPTPESVREQGVHAGQVNHGLHLREDALRLSAVQVIGREAVEAGGQTVELVKFRADIAVCDIINLNWRFYPRSAYEGAIARAQAHMASGKLTGLLEHPGWDDGWKGRLDNVAARWTALGIEDKEVEFPPDSGVRVVKPVVWGEGVYVRTSAGETVQTLMQDGVFVGISTNGYSSVEWKPFGELGIPDPTGLIDPEVEIPVTGDDLTFLTVDFVALPANSGGQVYAESGGYSPPPTRRPLAPSPALPATAPEPLPPIREAQEEAMHPKLKALLGSLGKTLEQVRTEHASEYLSTLEEIARGEQANTESAAQLATVQAQLTQAQTQLAQTQAALRQSEGLRVQETRTARVDAAIAAAELPQLPPLKLGDQSIDLNAKWREGLLAAALAAETDEAADALIAEQIAVRAHELAGQQAEGAAGVRPLRTPAPAPELPVGDNDAAPSLSGLQESAMPLPGNPYIQRMRG